MFCLQLYKPKSNMETHKIILEYPRGISLDVTVIGDDGKPVNSITMGPDVLLRLGANLEVLSIASGNVQNLLEMSGSDSEDDDDDVEEDEGLDSNDDQPSMDWDTTIDLVSDDDDVDDEDDEDDEIVITYTVE